MEAGKGDSGLMGAGMEPKKQKRFACLTANVASEFAHFEVLSSE